MCKYEKRFRFSYFLIFAIDRKYAWLVLLKKKKKIIIINAPQKVLHEPWLKPSIIRWVKATKVNEVMVAVQDRNLFNT